MTAMGKLASKTEETFQGEAYSHGHIRERLEHWRRELVAYDAGQAQGIVSRGEIVRTLDRWLDALAELHEIRCFCGDECKERKA